MNVDLNTLKEEYIKLMLEEIKDKDEDTQLSIINLSTKFFKILESKFDINLKENTKELINLSMLNMSYIPNCCKDCNNYKGDKKMNMCNCVLPYLEQMADYVNSKGCEIIE